ncbi:MAG: F0F1 ATP synthase subunit A [Planctomycetes bacterium]|nr:F0F1 ATP synthase subunit A [Planctomycetota bacterium]
MTMCSLLLASSNILEEIVSKEWKIPLGPYKIPFSNHMLMIMVACLLLMIILPLSLQAPVLVRKGFGSVIETICVFLREDVVRPFLKEHTDRYIGVLWTLFFFILTMNLLGLMPIDKVIFLITKKDHIGGAPTANIYVTGALATFSFFLFHIAGIREKGLWNYLRTFTPQVPWPMLPFMFILEAVSSFVRLFSLAIRLFANILAGHILLAVILGFIMIFKTFMAATGSLFAMILFSLLEIFVAFLQAYIFVFLTTIFIGFAVAEEH